MFPYVALNHKPTKLPGMGREQLDAVYLSDQAIRADANRTMCPQRLRQWLLARAVGTQGRCVGVAGRPK